MKKIMLLSLLGLLIVGFYAMAQAAPPENVEGMYAYLNQFIAAVAAGDWKIVGGLVLMLAMAALRQYVLPKAKINPAHLPFILIGISALAFSGMAMLAPGVSVLDGLKAGFVTSGVAALLWDAGGKYLIKLLFGEIKQA